MLRKRAMVDVTKGPGREIVTEPLKVPRPIKVPAPAPPRVPA